MLLLSGLQVACVGARRGAGTHGVTHTRKAHARHADSPPLSTLHACGSSQRHARKDGASSGGHTGMYDEAWVGCWLEDAVSVEECTPFKNEVEPCLARQHNINFDNFDMH